MRRLLVLWLCVFCVGLMACDDGETPEEAEEAEEAEEGEEGEEAEEAEAPKDGEEEPDKMAKEGEEKPKGAKDKMKEGADKAGAEAPMAESTKEPAMMRLLLGQNLKQDMSVHMDGKPWMSAKDLGTTVGATKATQVPSGPHWFSARGGDDGDVELAATGMDLKPGGAYLMVLADAHAKGKNKGKSLIRVLRDDQKEKREPQQAHIRFVNASADLASLDALLQSTEDPTDPKARVMFGGVGLGKGTAYRAVDAGSKILTVRSGLTPDVKFYEMEQFDLTAGERVIMMFTGGPRLNSDTAHVRIIRDR